MINSIRKLKVQIFADGADYKSMISLSKKKYIKGLTTNPSLMRKAGIKNYVNFAKKVVKNINNKSISLEVFADSELEIENKRYICRNLEKMFM